MSQKIPVKIYLLSENAEETVIRKFALHQKELIDYSSFSSKIPQFFPELEGKVFKIYWKDVENDIVAISSQEEMQMALKEMEPLIVKFYVRISKKPEKEQNEDKMESNDIHQSVFCDGCNGSVIGYRYKCLACSDYDLCNKCEQAGVHSEHPMIRIPNSFLLSRNDISKMMLCFSNLFPLKFEVKHSKHSKKHSHTHSNSHKKRRCDKHDSGPETGEESDENHRKKRCYKKCVYSQLMNDFFKPYVDTAEFDPEEISKADRERKSLKTKAELTRKTLRSMIQTINSFLDPLEIGVDFEVRPGVFTEEKQKKREKKDQTEKREKEEQTETSAAATPSAPSLVKEVRFSTTEENSENLTKEIEEITKDLANQKINQSTENDGWVSFEELASEEPQASTSTGETSKILKTGESSPREEKAMQEPKKNIYPALSSEQQTPRDKVVRNALEKMLAMGFTNEGDWLTHLLEAKNGDINQALEVLAPHKK